MSNPLEDLKKLRRGVEKPRRKRVETDSVPVQDLALDSIPTPEELWEYFQKEVRYRNETHEDRVADEADGQVAGSFKDAHGWAPYAIPFRTIRKLKRARDDYKHGPVKVYTKEEIEEYEKQRDAKG